MKFNFKIQQYQTDAVESTIKVFKGQSHYEKVGYTRDLGNIDEDDIQTSNPIEDEFGEIIDLSSEVGFKNGALEMSDEQLLRNVHDLQTLNNIKLSSALINDHGRCSLDIEMETGTGKTYVYIKTIFELNKVYGWSKFIIVVPSIAIREGVKKSFEITVDHFMEHYGKKTRFFIYNSSNLNELDNFSSSSGINVMIINTQACASSLKVDSKSKDSLIINSKRDEFGARRPIDVIKANRPILILDEPQKMGGAATQEALKNLTPLFSLNYSATHKKQHNLIYVLDALDAYNKRLVKKIEVKGFEVKNLGGTDKYLYLENIEASATKPTKARIEIEIKLKSGAIKRRIHICEVGYNLYTASRELEQYKDLFIAEINPLKDSITLSNGDILYIGNSSGDISEKNMRRIQIRETIISHFDKEERLFNMGIKTLSLFFIDEVAKYRIYDEDGDEQLGEYGQIFEEEYTNILNECLTPIDTPYQKYLKSIGTTKTHKGYFSIDKKGKSVNSTVKRGSEYSDDISAYDLILKNRERLLSFDEQTRFIFSHSALREGWDNPNVFQICTLKHSDSSTVKRQEVGRGLRLCVNQLGNRMDPETCGDDVHSINVLTVIASESYKAFVDDLQKQIKAVLYDRPSKATIEYFEGKTIILDEQAIIIDIKQAKAIYKYLLKNDYIDDEDNVTKLYRTDFVKKCLVEFNEELKPISEGIHTLIQGIFDENVFESMVCNGNKTKIVANKLNANFFKKEFQTLWSNINHKYAYTVEFDSNQLIEQSIKYINETLFVSRMQCTTSIGEQRVNMNENELGRKASFSSVKTRVQIITSHVKYDLVGKIVAGAVLTRKTVVAILQGLAIDKLQMFKNNPEEFISKVIKLVKEQKAMMIVDNIVYVQLEATYDDTIFTADNRFQSLDKAFTGEKHIQDYVLTDSTDENSIERQFAKELDDAEEVCAYAKLPNGFYIPTPLGNYSPTWAIAFYEGKVKHLCFVADIKHPKDRLQRKIEDAKISCAKKLFNSLSTNIVKYHEVDDCQELLKIVR